MDQEKKVETPGQGNVPQKLNELHRKLLVGFALIAGVAIGAYVFRFWGWPLSENPSDWAHFATYLSGTVGVTAVVATLIVLVRTLGQQQALIDSQDKMLVEQRRQIFLAETQHIELEKKHKVDIAYSNAREIFPSLVISFDSWRKCNMSPYPLTEGSLRSEFMSRFESSNRSASYLMINPLSLLNVLMASKVDEVESYMARFFKPVNRLYDFMCQQVKVSYILYGYFDSEFFGRSENAIFFFKCYQAYLIGFGDGLYLKGVEMLELERDYSESSNDILVEWQDLGQYLRSISKRDVVKDVV